MSSKNFVEGPGNAKKSQYFRTAKNQYPEYMTVANKILKSFSTPAGNIRMMFDPLMTLPYRDSEVEEFNRMRVVTHGKWKGTHAYVSSVHVDSKDVVKYKEQAAASKRVSAMLGPDFKNPHVVALLDYGQRFIDSMNHGKPTTVLYQHVPGNLTMKLIGESGKLKVGKVIQFFVMDGLQCTHRIKHGTEFIMCAWTFSHGSSIPVQEFDDNTCSIQNDNDSHIVAFAFAC